MPSTAAPEPIVLVANARMPSQRAQSLQVAQAAAAFARRGAPTTLLHARRHDTPKMDAAQLWRTFGVDGPECPAAHAVSCIDWIDRTPRRLQFLPARVQELSFAANAARRILSEHAGARVLSRELETARALRRRPGVFLEMHRVPGGRLRRRWLLEAARECAGLVAISGGVRTDLIELGVDPGAIVVEHDAYDSRRYATPPTRAAARSELGLAADVPLVVYTGGLLQWKGVDVLIDAARELSRDVQILIVGGMDRDVERLRQRAAGLERVRIDGFRPAQAVPAYLAAADVAVVPNRAAPAISARYTSPLKVFEAMAVGLPMVVSDLPSLRDILTDEQALFVPPEDAHALARGLTDLLASPARREEMRTAQRAVARERTWDARAERLLDWMDARV